MSNKNGFSVALNNEEDNKALFLKLKDFFLKEKVNADIWIGEIVIPDGANFVAEVHPENDEIIYIDYTEYNATGDGVYITEEQFIDQIKNLNAPELTELAL